MAPPERKPQGPAQGPAQGPVFEPLEPPKLSLPPRTRVPGAAAVVPMPVSKGAQATEAADDPAAVSVPPKPLQNAVAITYRGGGSLPQVVAKGRGLVAEQIIARAREHGVAVHESKELVALLMQVELDDHIPPALYRAVAELLAWLYQIEKATLGGSKVS
jgi:flagellar biosynthesis protein